MQKRTDIIRMCGRSKLIFIFMYICSSCIFYSCSESQKSVHEKGDAVPSIPLAKEKTVVVNDNNFLAMFPRTSGDTIHIYSPNDKTGGDKFSGKPIPREFYKYFPLNEYFKHQLKDEYVNIFSIANVTLSDNLSGLIVRVPATYSETALELFVWDNRTKRIIDNINLADETGDAGWYFVQDAWITDLNNDRQSDVLIRRKDHWDKDMDGMDGKERNLDSVKVFIGEDGKFRKARLAIDTTRFQLFNWIN